MKKLISLITLVALLGSCKKESIKVEEKPTETPAVSTIDTTWRLKSIINYSTTATTTLNESQLLEQSVDSSYYEFAVNGISKLKFKMNWTYTNTPAYNNIKDLKELLNLKLNDVVTLKIIWRTPRTNYTDYTFNVGISWVKGEGKKYPDDFEHLFVGQYKAYKIEPTQSGYEANKVSYSITLQTKINH